MSPLPPPFDVPLLGRCVTAALLCYHRHRCWTTAVRSRHVTTTCSHQYYSVMTSCHKPSILQREAVRSLQHEAVTGSSTANASVVTTPTLATCIAFAAADLGADVNKTSWGTPASCAESKKTGYPMAANLSTGSNHRRRCGDHNLVVLQRVGEQQSLGFDTLRFCATSITEIWVVIWREAVFVSGHPPPHLILQ